MTEDRIGVAVVGCGVISRSHIAALSGFEEYEIVALVDPSEEARHRALERVVAASSDRPALYESLDDALADPRVRLVSVCTPTGLHVEQGIAALTAGRHVVIEKPLGVDMLRVPEIQYLADKAAAAGMVASVISQHRLDPATFAVAGAIADGAFGTVTSAIATSPRWRTQEYYDSGDWRGTWEMDGGGALMNQGVHTLDLLLALMGRPVEVFARTALLAHERIEVEDTMVATIVFESGALATMHASTAANPGLTSRIQVMGSAGSAIIDNDELVYFHVDGRDDAPQASEPGEYLDAIDHPAGHALQYADVLHAIRSGAAPAVRIEDAAVALATVRAVYISATLGQPVLVEDVASGSYDETPVRTGAGVAAR